MKSGGGSAAGLGAFAGGSSCLKASKRRTGGAVARVGTGVGRCVRVEEKALAVVVSAATSSAERVFI